MWQRFLHCLTTLTMLAHAILGCGWHHSHTESGEAAETVNAAPAIPHCRHHAAAKSPLAAGETCGTEFPADDEAPESECSHGSCVYLAKQTVQSLVGHHFLALWTVPMDLSSAASSQMTGQRECSGQEKDVTGMGLCILFQSWTV
ncbi:hypothetical protein [Planctomicrobium sp. SH664]|uniref:hypothetical protein n=1 Tax=Planctomicrobium sp. SH664 TaxID=3448125 RepID=UPI003F5C1202